MVSVSTGTVVHSPAARRHEDSFPGEGDVKEIEAVFIHSPDLDLGGYPIDAPFNIWRARMVSDNIHSKGLIDGRQHREAEPVKAARPELEKFHRADYLDAMIAAEEGNLTPEAFSMGLGSPDCPVFVGMFDHASWAAGASLTGARMILAGETHVAFNPSGGFHHAGPAKASGFCYINDLVLAAMAFADAGKRVLYLDLDVHHGDGVQDAFYNRSDVMTVSLHESGKTLFPGDGFEDEIGTGPGKGYNLNIPLPVGTYDAAYERAFREAALPVIKKYDPDVFIMQLGMDGLSGDPLAHLSLTNNVHADTIHTIMGLNKPILATGGGGYNVDNTVRGWTLAWYVLTGEEDQDLTLGLGGVMLENVEWSGGFRDRVIMTDVEKRAQVNAEIDRVIERIRSEIFPLHDLT
jgi:acetoin utilization protein AcuC